MQELEISRQLVEEKEQKKRSEKEKIVECVLTHGLWRTQDEIVQGLKNLTKTKMNAVLKSQIRFWTVLLEVKTGNKLSFTKASVEELQRHLCIIANERGS